ncbi:ras-like GTP-binding protein RhoL [Culicoides brevitarsis]|uniref:ras-like GTP-binding protein RhoL n=1 Tax=Culicoides brevitarsis TaxID=469753 RepID=UPI00307BD339
MKQLKIVSVGNRVGKTCLHFTTIHGNFPDAYELAVYYNNNYSMTQTVDNKEYHLQVWDVPCQDDSDDIRPASLPDADCILICYSIENRASFENILTKWYPEMKFFAPDAPIILVGMKADLRDPKSGDFVTTEEGKKMKEKIGAFAFVECSAMKKINLDEVYCQAVRAVEEKK